MGKKTAKLTVQLEPGAKGRLRAIAKGLGILSPVGPTYGQGSVAGLFDAIAKGELVVTKAEAVIAL